MVHYANGLMKLVDVEVIEKFMYVVQFGCDEWLYCYVYRRWKIRGDSCFGHLESVNRLAFSGQLASIIDMLLLNKYFPQKFGFVGENSKGKGKWKVVKGKGKVKTAPKKAMKKVSMTCVELETVFKQCEDEDDALKIRLVYFTKGVLIGAKSNVSMNLEYLDLVEDMDSFNTYSWGAISFEQV
ncbi:unnamed protein product [Malus baccata var. baccata]